MSGGRVRALYSSMRIGRTNEAVLLLQKLDSQSILSRQLFGEARWVGRELNRSQSRLGEISRCQCVDSSRNSANASSSVEFEHQGSKLGMGSLLESISGSPLPHATANQCTVSVRPSHAIKSVFDCDIRADRFSAVRAGSLSPGFVQLINKMKFGTGVFEASQTSRQTNVAGPGPNAVSTSGSASGSKKVVARILGTPRFMFKSDIIWFLKECNIIPEDVFVVYDTKLRTKYIEVKLDSEKVRVAQKEIGSKGLLGGRYVKLHVQEAEPLDETNEMLLAFRGQSLLMVKIPSAAMTEHIERFFSGYNLDKSYSIKFLRTLIQPKGGMGGYSQGSAVPVKREFETRALVRFKSELEALRALREKQGSICLDAQMELRFIE